MKITPELMVDHLDEVISFYTQYFGFAVETLFPEKEPFFAVLKKDQAEVMLYARTQFAEELPEFRDLKLGGSFVLYIEVSNIDELLAKMRQVSKIVQPMHETSYGTREFSCLDPSGYVLMISQRS